MQRQDLLADLAKYELRGGFIIFAIPDHLDEPQQIHLIVNTGGRNRPETYNFPPAATKKQRRDAWEYWIKQRNRR